MYKAFHDVVLFYQLKSLNVLTLFTFSCTRHFTMYYLQMCCPTKNVNDTHDHNTINNVLSYRRTKALSMCVSKDAIQSKIQKNKSIKYQKSQ